MPREETLGQTFPCRRVLLAEDDRALLELLTEYLELQGLEVTAVETGDAALRALGDKPPPDLVVLDIRMPGIPGDEVLRRMRADPELARIPVAAMTGMRDVELLTPPDEFLPKPFDVETLAQALLRMCSVHGSRPRDPSAAQR
jgi:CheY-like chemotaxis protein